MVEEPDSENSLFSEPMKMRTPSARSARPSRSITSRRVSRSSNKSRTRSRSASALRSSSRCAWPRTISLRSSLSPPDQLAKPVGDELLGQLVELGLARLQRAFDLDLALASVLPRMRALRKFAGLGQRRGRQAGRNVEHAVFDLAVLGDQHDQRALRLEPHEFDMLEPRVGLGGQHDAGGAAQAGQKSRRFGQHRSRRDFDWPDAATCASIALRSFSVRSPICISASTKKRSPISVGSRPAEVCGA